MKKTYVAEGFPNITRTTNRIYTHAVVAPNSNRPGFYGYLGFCGSEKLAQSLYSKWAAIDGVKIVKAIEVVK